MKITVCEGQHWMEYIVVDQYNQEINAKSFDDESHEGEFYLFNSKGTMIQSYGEPVLVKLVISDAKFKCLAIDFYFRAFMWMVEEKK